MTSKRRHKRTARREKPKSYNRQVVIPFAGGETHQGRCMKPVQHPTVADAVCYRAAGHELVDDKGCDADITMESFTRAMLEQAIKEQDRS